MFPKFVVLFLILGSDFTSKIYAYREIKIDGVDTVLAMEGETQVVVNCKKDIPMAYCGFLHPNGTRFSFSGMELIDGRCSMTLPNVTKQDSGMWKCYIGKKTVGAEIITKVSVRVADRFAAVEPLMTAADGNQVTLLCTTTKAMVPLTYCRFEPPSGDAFSINADITSQQPILEKYFFPENKSLNRGDCAVTIKRVKHDDVGNWTCGAGLEDDGKVYSDVIKLEVEGLQKMSTAATTGITFAVISIVIIIGAVAYIFWKKYSLRQSFHEQREQYEMNPQDPQCGIIPLVVVQSPSEPSASSTQLST